MNELLGECVLEVVFILENLGVGLVLLSWCDEGVLLMVSMM